MARDETLRRRLVDDAMACRTGDVADVAAELWRSLALHLVSIIGENGFHSLYARTLHLANEHYPWLALGDASRPTDFQFVDLKNSLGGQDPGEADKASQALLLMFIDLLVSLIGESVTLAILRSAWAEDASERETAGKEFPHE